MKKRLEELLKERDELLKGLQGVYITPGEIIWNSCYHTLKDMSKIRACRYANKELKIYIKNIRKKY